VADSRSLFWEAYGASRRGIALDLGIDEPGLDTVRALAAACDVFVTSPTDNQEMTLGPKTTGYFATEVEIDFFRPVVVGERVGRRSRRLMSCVPKETSVGRGMASSHNNVWMLKPS
jgi:hypothetical protein